MSSSLVKSWILTSGLVHKVAWNWNTEVMSRSTSGKCNLVHPVCALWPVPCIDYHHGLIKVSIKPPAATINSIKTFQNKLHEEARDVEGQVRPTLTSRAAQCLAPCSVQVQSGSQTHSTIQMCSPAAGPGPETYLDKLLGDLGENMLELLSHRLASYLHLSAREGKSPRWARAPDKRSARGAQIWSCGG